MRNEPAGTRRDVVCAVAATMASSLPVFLVGALAVQLREALHFGTGTLGAIVALYFLGAAASSIPLGGFVETIGGLRTMRIAVIWSSLLLLLLATVTRSWPVLALLMVPAGMASSAVQLGSNLFLVRRVPAGQQGVAFGFKQAAVPLAASLGGLAVPVLALTVGWRAAFLAAALAAAATAVLLPRPRQSLAERRAAQAGRPAAPLDRRPLWVLAAGIGLGVATASALTAFLVSSAVADGVGRAPAGLLIAFGGAVAGISRIITGRRADRRGRAHLRVIAAMLTSGAFGYGALALASSRHLGALYIPAVAIAFAAGWGWNGLFNFTIVRTHPDQPARATALTQAGARLGAMVGP
ncbi:MAG TPA: MFS transporter, partial [Solirubrobacteraceae bacterium]|nr:MFS transporter [Solirubrobacteraceae bacterium]